MVPILGAFDLDVVERQARGIRTALLERAADDSEQLGGEFGGSHEQQFYGSGQVPRLARPAVRSTGLGEDGFTHTRGLLAL